MVILKYYFLRMLIRSFPPERQQRQQTINFTGKGQKRDKIKDTVVLIPQTLLIPLRYMYINLRNTCILFLVFTKVY